MRNYSIVLFTATIATTATASESTHCKIHEKTIFNCQIENSEKFASICSSDTLDRENGYVQYRFGKSGNVELEFPKYKNHSQKEFLLGEMNHYHGAAQISYTEKRFIFKISNYTYSVSYAVKDEWQQYESNKQDDGREVSTVYGRVTITRPGQNDVILSCNKPEMPSIPEGVFKCEEDSAPMYCLLVNE